MKLLLCDNNLRQLINFRLPVILHYLNKGWEVVLVYPNITYDAEWCKDLPSGCRLIGLDMKPSGMNIVEDLFYLKELWRIYKKEKPSVIVHYTIKPNIYGTIAATLSRIKCRIAVVAGLGNVFVSNSVKAKVALGLYRFALRFASKVVTLNEVMRDRILALGAVSEQNCVLFECGEGVDLDRFRYSPNRYEHIRFLMIARLLYDKGYREFVEASRIVAKRYSNVSFELLGHQDLSSPMSVPKDVLERDLVEGPVRYLGATARVPEVLSEQGVVVVLPSYHEGMNRVLMEACAVGRPAIASDIPGCRELVKENENGYLVPPKNAQALSEAMIRFIELPEEKRIRMGYAAHDKAKTHLDMRFVLKKYDRLLEEMGILIES